jgi:hypothetical protein
VGFGIQMTNWVMSCVTSSSFAILLNSEAIDFFRSGRGLRQGCPLSPLLFIMVMEGLSLLLKNNIGEGKLSGIKVSRLINILHLLFVDDVLIMTKDSLHEWIEISKIINLFCKASGLTVNQAKTTVHYEGISEDDLAPFKSVLPYTFCDLSINFKYLGYFLKTGMQKAEDWGWLVSKLTKKIGLWCNRWLSMGGRYVLVKTVLEGQPIFWMSMEAIPRSILCKIRKLMFHFLWHGHKDTQHFHLCRWETLSRPKKNGGWGFQNLAHFNLALNASSLWRVLTQGGIWHKVIMDKYFSHVTVINWLRLESQKVQSASRIWTSLTNSVHIINQWLAWSPGSRHLIALGRDNILGIGDKSFLSTELLSILNQKKIIVLAQASEGIDPISLSEIWINNNSLGISGEFAKEWDDYIAELRGAISHFKIKLTLCFGMEEIRRGTSLLEIYIQLFYLLRISRFGEVGELNYGNGIYN